METQHKRWADLCTYCPTLCLFSCPVSAAEGRDTVSPWGKMSLAAHVATGRVPLDADAARVFYACMGCLACRTVCMHDVEVPRVLLAARQRAIRRGLAVYPAELFRRATEENRALLRAALPAARFVDETQVLLVPGVDTILHAPHVIAHLFAVTDALGIDYLAVGQASAFATGYWLWTAGFEDEFRVVATRFQAEVKRYRRLVVLSPHDLYLLRVVYPELGIPLAPAISFAGDLLLERLRGRRAPNPVPGVIRYHDPCYLSRHLSIQETPRALLGFAAGAPPGELRWSGDSSRCCGAGNGVDVTSPATAAGAAEAVVQNALDRGTDTLAVACATCARSFRAVSGAPAVADVISLVAQSLGLVPPGPASGSHRGPSTSVEEAP